MFQSVRFAQRIRKTLVVLGLLSVATASFASSAQRIATVDDSARTRLKGSVSPKLARATDLGAMTPDTLLGSMALRFSLTAAQQADLNSLLGQLQDPASPNYHQWLTPEQFGARFGIGDADLAQVKQWLASKGFAVTEVSRGGQFVRFSGTVAQAQAAFQTSIDRVSVDGEQHFANTAEPSLPSAIAAVTSTVTGLDDFRMKAHSIAKAVAPQAEKPEFTSSTGNHYLAPGDLYTIYDVSGLISNGVTGTGVSIAVLGQADVSLTSIAAFRTASGLAANAPTVKLYGTDPANVSGVDTTTDINESSLDLEWAGAMAPAASVIFVTSSDVLNGSLTEAIDQNVAPILSMSYGECEANLGVNKLLFYNTLLEQGAAEGITIVAPGGDSGASDCDYGAPIAAHGYAVDFPGSSPFATSVGGTEFNEGSGTYWSTTNGSYSGSATSHIPEVVWNDDALGNLAAGGGGASTYFVKPSWQTGTGVPSDGARDVPDVALTASALHDGYLFCTSGYCQNGYYSTTNYLAVIGGTEAATPVFAGMLALVEQKTGGKPLGLVNNKIYALANSAYYGNVFHDVVSGNNDSPCTAGTTDCASGAAFGYAAGPGYDLATGWGSVDAGNMVNDWGLVTAVATTPAGMTPTIVNLNGSPSNVAQGTTITMTATVASASSSVTTTPTGSAQFQVDGVNVGSAVALSGATATYTLNTSVLATGNHKVQVSYSGDGTYLGSRAAFTVTIASNTTPDFTFAPAAIAITVSSGTSSVAQALTVTPVNGFTGTVKFTISASNTTAAITPILSASSVSVTGTAAASTNVSFLAYTTASLGSAGWLRAGVALLLAAGLMVMAPKRRRLGLLAVVLAAVTIFGMSGCTNGNGPTQPSQVNAATGTYTYTVFATGTVNGSSVTHSSVITLTVD